MDAARALYARAIIHLFPVAPTAMAALRDFVANDLDDLAGWIEIHAGDAALRGQSIRLREAAAFIRLLPDKPARQGSQPPVVVGDTLGSHDPAHRWTSCVAATTMVGRMKIVVLGVVALLCGAAREGRADRPTKVEHVAWVPGTADTSGYEYATIDVAYSFLICNGNVVMQMRLRNDTLDVHQWYRFGAIRHLLGNAKPPHVSSVDFAGTFRKYGLVIGSFDAGRVHGQGSGGCLGQTAVVGSVKDLIGEKPPQDQIDTFLDSLSVVAYRASPPLGNSKLEAELGARVQKEKADKAAAEKAIRDKEAADKIAQDKALKDQAAKDQADKDQAAKDQTDKDKADKDKAASDAAVPNKPPSDSDPSKTTEDADQDIAQTAKQTQEAARQATAQKAAADAAEREENEEAKRKDDEARSAPSKWTDADERDTSGDYWPNSRCAWMDSDGFIQIPTGRNRCDPEYMKGIFADMRRQAAQEEARLEAERKREATRQAILMMGGGTPDGTLVVGAAAAMAPLVDKMGDGANTINGLFPRTFDIEGTARALFTGGTGHGVSIRAPGFFYVYGGYESFDSGKWSRVHAMSIGPGVQLPMTPKLTIRMIEIGVTLGSEQHVIDRASEAIGVNVRAGVVYRIVGGLAFSGMLGFTTTGGIAAYSDFGLLWRHSLAEGGKYLVR